MGQSPSLITLIFPAKNEGKYVRTTIESALRAKTNHPFEMIVVDDGSTDQSCDFIDTYECSKPIRRLRTEGVGLAKAKNLGAEHAKGDYLIFCDAHLFFEDFWLDRLIEPIQKGLADGTTPGIASTNSPQIIGYGQTLNQKLGVQWNVWKRFVPSAVLPGGCYAVSKSVFSDIGGFDQEFQVWGYEDVEISIKMWLFGYRCYAQPTVKILHLFRQAHPYTVSYEHFYYNMMRMAYSHFNDERIEKSKKMIKHADPEQIVASVLADGVMKQREEYITRRKYDDDWYMQKFRIPF
ncbi:glycosyltransferase family 2 protein [Ammoniphilus sp. 3BR4]|uniref:glycosyltransferase family 2 protein n=1 Tax=Ammoniphilus sp. 3BR4 TaxID=3158265 RepID=UPI003467923E